jgi:phosphoglycolate phosphatase
MFDAVVFDLDGTLSDPGVGIAEAVSAALISVDRPVPSEQGLRRFVGPPLDQSFRAIGLSGDETAAAVVAYRSHFATSGVRATRLYPGVRDALEALGAAGLRLAVATSKASEFATRVVEHLAISACFEAVVGSSESAPTKTEIVAEALRLLIANRRPDRVAMVGDRAEDVTAAAANGLVPIGVRWGYADAGELEAAGAGPIVATVQELVAVVAGT